MKCDQLSPQHVSAPSKVLPRLEKGLTTKFRHFGYETIGSDFTLSGIFDKEDYCWRQVDSRLIARLIRDHLVGPIVERISGVLWQGDTNDKNRGIFFKFS